METNFKNNLAPAVIELNRMNEELQAENSQLKKDLEHARSYKHTIKMRNRNLQTENERLKAENLKHREDRMTMSLKYNEVLNDLNDENEKLKGELEMEHDDCINAKKCEVEYHKAYEKELDENVTLRKENARLKCLALHLFSRYFFDCYWNIEGPDSIRYLHLHQKYDKAYRNEKKALRERK